MMRRDLAGKALATAVMVLMLALPASAQQAFTPQQKTAIEKMIHDYLTANPEVLVEAANVLEKRREAEEKVAQSRLLKENKAALFASADDFVDNPDGRIPVVEFFDYQCGYCKRIHAAVKKLRAETEDVRFVYKEYPILGPVSEFAARAAIASRAQGKYAAFHVLMMGSQGRLSERAVLSLAEKAGLDIAKLRTDMEAPAVQAVIQRNLQLGQTMGIRGTPAMFIGDTYVPGAIQYSQMTDIVASTRENCSIC